jgi:hypothetical protein
MSQLTASKPPLAFLEVRVGGKPGRTVERVGVVLEEEDILVGVEL